MDYGLKDPKKIWAGSRPHLFSMARLQAHIVLMDFSVLISICLDQVSFWSMWTPKYFTYFFNWIGLSKMERPIVWYFLFWGTRRASALLGLTLSPFFWLHSWILERAYWAVSKHVLISVPSIVMTMPSAYPRHQIWWSVSRFIRELATRFHNIGDQMPPYGQPLDTIHANVCPWWLIVMLNLGENGLSALLVFDYHIRSGMVKCPMDAYKNTQRAIRFVQCTIQFCTKLV